VYSAVHHSSSPWTYIHLSHPTDSALAQIVSLVESAQMNKAPVQAYADRLAGIFTPVILLLGIYSEYTYIYTVAYF
jgi:cation transport ATPase